ncbi:uncharacterized protein LOC143297067 [Babylonia areolata]|uniref:uncharacterized protein LOC143297067 n=1 Tax=Babylonia areolata TaxID=304850 RepID=UPI003FD6B361
MSDTIHTVVDALKHRARLQPSGAAFIFRDPTGDRRHVQTFRDVYRLGRRCASVLRRSGLVERGRGDLVANALPNCPERVVAEAGVLLTGAATVNAQCLLADGSDLLATLRNSRARAVLVAPGVEHSPWLTLRKHVTTAPTTTRGVSSASDESEVAVVLDVVSSEELPDLKKVLLVRRGPPGSAEDFLSMLEAEEEEEEGDVVAEEDVCSVFTTSGSSGFSKLVAHTHRGLVHAVLRVNPVYEGLTGKQVEFSMAPLGWMGGYVGNTILTGSTRVLADTHDGLPKDLIGFILRAFQEEGVATTFIPCPQAACTALQVLDRVTLGGQPITRSHVQMASKLARAVFLLYGSTETFLLASHTVPDPDSFQDFDCGEVVRGGEVRVVSPGGDESTPLPPGQSGMLLVRREVMMKEYFHDPQATRAAFTADGFFRTGDIGRVDAARGHVFVEGRGSDAIMRGPYIFYPGWLEERIRACPGVRDAMVVGVPDPLAHEELCACVTLAPGGQVTMQEVQEFVERDVAPASEEEEPLSPRPRHYLTFDAFPTTSTGKPHRSVVKRQATARLSSASSDDLN